MDKEKRKLTIAPHIENTPTESVSLLEVPSNKQPVCNGFTVELFLPSHSIVVVDKIVLCRGFSTNSMLELRVFRFSFRF